MDRSREEPGWPSWERIKKTKNSRNTFPVIILVLDDVPDRVRGGVLGEPQREPPRKRLHVQDVARENEGLGCAWVGERAEAEDGLLKSKEDGGGVHIQRLGVIGQ